MGLNLEGELRSTQLYIPLRVVGSCVCGVCGAPFAPFGLWPAILSGSGEVYFSSRVRPRGKDAA